MSIDLAALCIQVITLVCVILILTIRDKKHFLTKELSLQFVAVLAVAWSVLTSVEYFAAGGASYIRVGDEGEVSFPWYLYLSTSPLDGIFDPSVGGGSERPSILAMGGQSFSIERVLFSFLPPWFVLGLHKVSVILLATLGGYRLARVVGAKSAPALAIGGAYSLSFRYLTDISLTQSFGYAAMPFLASVICFAPRRAGLVLAAALIWGSGALPIHAGLPLAVALLAIGWYCRAWKSIGFWAAAAAPFVVEAINWAEVLSAMVSFAPLTARLKNFSPSINTNSFVSGLLLEPSVAIFAGMALLSTIRRRVDFRLLAMSAAPLLLYVLIFIVPWEMLHLGFVRGINFAYALFAIPTVAVVVFAELTKAAAGAQPVAGRKIGAALVAALLLAMPASMFVRYKVENLAYWLGLGAQNNIIAIPNLNDQSWRSDKDARAVAVPIHLTDDELLAYKIPTLGGYFNLTDKRRVDYWRMTGQVTESGRTGLHLVESACPASVQFDTLGDRALLRAANVRYVISKVPVEGVGLRQVSGPDPADWQPGCALPLKQRLARYVSERFRPPPAFVYDMGEGPGLIYFARSLFRPGNEMETWDEIRTQGTRQGIVIEGSVAEVSAPENGQVREWRYSRDTYSISVSAPHGGYLVLQHPWLPFWTAEIDGRPAAVLPINKLGMAVWVPAGASDVRFTYSRKLLVPIR